MIERVSTALKFGLELHGDGEPVLLIHPGISLTVHASAPEGRLSSAGIASCITTVRVVPAAAVWWVR